MKISKVIRLSLLIFSAAAFVFALWQLYLLNYLKQPKQRKPLEFPAEFLEGRKYNYSFISDINAEYEIAINFDHTQPLKKNDSLTGYIIPSGRSYRSISLPVSLSLYESGKRILSVDSVSRQSYYCSSNSIGRIIEVFTAGKGKLYNISVEIKRTIADLNQRNPKIIIKPAGAAIKREIINAQSSLAIHWYFFYISLGVFIILSTINVTWFIKVWISKREVKTGQ